MMSPAKGLSGLLIFSKNKLLVSLIFSILFFISISFISVLIFIISFLLLSLIFACSSLVTLGCLSEIFLGSEITADGDCSHEIKRHLLLGRKVLTNLDNILKSIDITLPTKVHLVKAMVFTVVMYGCESWTVKKAEHRRIDAFELWCWR